MSLSYRKVAPTFFRENENQGGLSEEYSKNASMPEFAIVAPNGVQIGSWMKCKDYIQDVWWGSKRGESYECYGFYYDPIVDPAPSSRFLLLAMRWKGKADKMSTCVDNVKRTVEDIEKTLKIPKHLRSRFSRSMGEMFVIYGSPKWLNTISLVSFFTWLLRASFNNSSGKFAKIQDSNPPVKQDLYYRNNGNAFIKKLLEDGIDSLDSDWENYHHVEGCHDGGFVNAAYKYGGGASMDDDPYIDDDDDDWF